MCLLHTTRKTSFQEAAEYLRSRVGMSNSSSFKPSLQLVYDHYSPIYGREFGWGVYGIRLLQPRKIYVFEYNPHPSVQYFGTDSLSQKCGICGFFCCDLQGLDKIMETP